MARLTVVAVGRLREAWQKAAVAEYEKRLRRYVDPLIREVPDVPDSVAEEAAREQEARAIRRVLPKGAYVVALDSRGETHDSLSFASFLQRGLEQGGAHLVFLIGGSRGLADDLLRASDSRLSLSRLTFTHGLARVLLLEQSYRALRLAAGEPYHK